MQTDFSFPESETPSFKEPTLFNLLPRRVIEIGGEEYTVFYESKTKEYDRCFVFSKEPDTEDMHFFSMQPLENGKVSNESGSLNEINMKDDNTVRQLVKVGKEMVDSEAEKIEDIREIPSKDIEIGGRQYRLSFQSPVIKIVGTSLEENYAKRVKGRWYQYN